MSDSYSPRKPLPDGRYGECHIRIRFFRPSIELDYHASHDTADLFTAAVGPSAAVTIDADITDTMPPLPCARLWTLPDSPQRTHVGPHPAPRPRHYADETGRHPATIIAHRNSR